MTNRLLLEILLLCIEASLSGRVPPWKYNGYAHLPVMYFGAPVDGIENTSVMTTVSKFDIAGWGWQCNFTGKNEAIYLYNQAIAFANYTKNNINAFNKTQSIFVYRNIISANAYFNVYEPIISSPQYDGFFIKNKDNKICSQYREYENIQWLDPIWDFRNESAQNWLLDNFIMQIVNEANTINTVFFDECDSIYCGFSMGRTNCTNFELSHNDLVDIAYANLRLLNKVGKLLNDNNIIPIYSTKNLFNEETTPCVIPQNVTMEYLSNVTWFRYYEFWPDNNHFLNYLTETQQYGFSNILIHASSYDVTNYSLATFLMGQEDYAYFSTSDGWVDANWKYQPEYDLIYGKPMTKPVKLNENIYHRSFTHCNVTLDTSQSTASIVHF
eukprot:93504_1